MHLKEEFTKPVYDDAPWLSDQLLLPQIARGRDVYLLSAFSPSYVFKLIEDLAKSKEIEPGFVNLVFFVPGDMVIRSESIARFHKYLLTYSDAWTVANFLSNSLKLFDETRENDSGGLQIQILHTSQKRSLAKGASGLIVDKENPEEYVAFIDAKGGDLNSPVQIYRSWDQDEEFTAKEVLGRLAAALNQDHPKARLISPREVEEWIIYLANYYEENPPIKPPNDIESDDSDSEIEGEDGLDEEDIDELIEHLLGLKEFRDEEKYGWFGEADDEFDLGPVTVQAPRDQAIDGHVPPLEPFLASLMSSSEGVARCICGQKFIRAYGCGEVSWDRWIMDYRPDM